jgi:cell division protease FtsH
MLARATAGEAGVPFFSCSGSEFVELFVGVGAARLRDLFERAKKSAPCIVFIDEIDAVGRKRNGHAGNEERDQTLNQILVEMDGFDQRCNVVVMAATNRSDVLDPALLRPGRFDRRIVVDSPGAADRLAILGIHARGKPLSAEVDLEKLARQTVGFSGADLENVMNEAALLAARGYRDRIQLGDLEEAVDRVLVGLARKSAVIGEREKWVTAYHECGHALVAHRLAKVDPVQRVSIIPRGGTGGHTRLVPVEDRSLWSRSQLKDGIAFALGGMAAEELVFGEMTTGSAGDLAEANRIARKMVCSFGMSREFGPVVLIPGDEGGPASLSESMASRTEAEIRGLLEEGRQRAAEILQKEMGGLRLLAERLFEEETLQGEELSSLIEGRPVAVPTEPLQHPAPEAGGPVRVAASK